MKQYKLPLTVNKGRRKRATPESINESKNSGGKENEKLSERFE
jgi:hypothetical protein